MPGDVRITGDGIVFLTASEDAEATKECCADTLPLLSPEGCCDVTRANQCVLHHTFTWAGEVGAALKGKGLL